MPNYYGATNGHGFAEIEASWHRRYDERPLYLVTLGVSHSVHGFGAGGHVAAYLPQAHAVMDDQGNLVIVEAWH